MNNQLVSCDPSNGTAIGEVTVTAISGVPDVVSRALTAQKSWRNISVGDRVALIAKASKLVEKQASELSTLLSREMGKDIGRSSGEVSGCIYGAPHIAQQVEQAIRPKQVSGSTIEYRPLGVAAVISPWNYPLMMAVNLMIPALVAGNTVVFKPSEETPLIAQAYVDLLNEVLPPDVLQIIHGGAEQGQALVESNVNIIAFTGSREAGIDIMRRASGSLKRLVMELGGNDPMLVTRDADIRAAARFAVASSFENAGQMCTSTERIYVDESVADEFEKQVTMIASQYNIGPWNQQRVNIGPIINQRQRSKIIMHIDDAVGKGARVLLGGKDHPEHYVTPTVVADVAPGMLMEQEETFGPVVSISRYSSLDQAIERANDSEYGLGAVVFTGADGPEIASKLEAGMVGINGGAGGGGDVPWVGAKQSGFGFHGSTDGHRQFTQVRVTR